MKKIFAILLLAAMSCGTAQAAPVPVKNNEGAYVIENAGHLKWFRNAVNGGQTEINAILSNDIDLGGQSWVPVGNTAETAYNGIFNGGGRLIRGLSVRGGGPFLGLFGCLDYGSIVSNLKIENAGIVFEGRNKSDAGVIAGQARGIIDSCFVTKSEVRMTAGGTGMTEFYADAIAGVIAGVNDEGVIINCVSLQNRVSITVREDVGERVAAAGGICGMNVGTMPGVGLLMNCESRGNELILAAGSPGSNGFGGGIVGLALGGIIRRCETLGGSIAGSAFTGGGSALGGVIGSSMLGSYIENCRVGGDIVIRADEGTAESSIGGVAGDLVGSNVSGCAVKDVILSASGKQQHSIGGISGTFANGKISDCRVASVITPKNEKGNYNLGAVAGVALVVQINGVYGETMIENTYFHGTIADGIAIAIDQATSKDGVLSADPALSADIFR